MTRPAAAPLIADVDVAVVGSGSAGAVAAIAAARAGAHTVLVERSGFLGGTSTAVLDTIYGFYTPGDRPKKVVGGIADDVLAALRGYGLVLQRPNTFGAGTGVTYHPEHLKVVWDDLTAAAGVQTLLYTQVQAADTCDGQLQTLTVATKAGLAGVRARVVVDASGDADVCHFAGFGYEAAGSRSPAQTLTTTFKMVNVDLDRRLQLPKAAVHQLMAEAAESGDYDLPRREGSDHRTVIGGVMATIMTRIPSTERRGGTLVNATDPGLLARAETAGRRQALEYARFLHDRVPGYENAALVSLSAQIGVRETRRVFGDYRITREDVLSARHFDDDIGLCGAPIEDHREGTGTTWAYLPDGSTVGIPLRSLVVRDATNVLVAGRCFSATHDAQASIRSMAQCMAMGQAAGTVAALTAANPGGEVRKTSYAQVQQRLRADAVVLQTPTPTTP